MAKATDKTAKSQMDFIDEATDTLEGFEGITSSTMAIPFIRMLQTLSPQLDEDKSEYIKGAKKGQWFNTVTKEVYGSEIKVIVLSYEQVYIEWLPNRGGFQGYHSPENAKRLAADLTFGKWKHENGNDLRENYVYLVLVEGKEDEGVAVLSLASSGIKYAKEWNRLMTTTVLDDGKRAKPYYLVYRLEQVYKENDQGSWFLFQPIFDHFISPEQYLDNVTPERKILPDRTVDYAQIGSSTSESEQKETEY